MSTRIATPELLPEGLRTVDEALHRTRFRILPFLGPAFIACVAYVDPGNFATNIAAGAKYGYLLLWVVVASSLMAMVIQTLSAKLGIATGRNLPEVCREHFSRRTSVLLWVQAEAIAMATDLAEFLGAAIGFNLLLGTSLFVSTVLAAIAAFGLLGLQSYGFRPFEAAIATLVGLIGLCYLVEIFYARPDAHAAADGLDSALRRLRVGADRGRDPRGDRDAACDLPALGPDPGSDRARIEGERPAVDALHTDRRAHGDDDRDADQRARCS